MRPYLAKWEIMSNCGLYPLLGAILKIATIPVMDDTLESSTLKGQSSFAQD